MKLAACFLTLLPGFAVAASWTSPGFPAFSEQGTGTFVSHAQLPKGTRPLTINFDQQCWQPADAIKLNQMLSLQPCSNTPPQWRLFRDGEYTLQLDTRSGTPTLMISIQNAVEPVASLVRECPKWDGLPLTLDVSATFPEGAAVRDYYSQQIAIVKNGQITLQPAATSNGLLLLERAETDAPAPFDWHNATVYFVLTDRFENGDPSNDQSYGRHKDGMAEIGTFHGGDLRGLTNKLDYLQQLGVNALWISAPFEQIHGWVGGGTKGDFPHYAYHGYYTQDWTNLDANMGSEADLRTLVDSAHQRGIRILFDVVMNHTGYATLADMQEYQFGALYLSGDEVKKTLGERWSDWKPAAGQQLKTEASAALREWKKANPDKALDDKPFWMTGEAWGHGVMQSDYYRHGFDAMINFDYQEQAAKAVDCLAQMDTTWQQMAEKLQDFNVLSYLSSHDTRLFREGGDKAAELLLLAPGAVQIFYGDESSRPFGPTGSDPLQGTRSDMNWQDVSGKSAASVAHWQKISQFRARHPAIGAGKQTTLSLKQGYGFVREHGDDKVLVIWAGQQ
ncbi:alpha-amylase [Escherichia coli]|nr:alpha-amylase [Escherichia coli]